jgi:hypothetical protein
LNPLFLLVFSSFADSLSDSEPLSDMPKALQKKLAHDSQRAHAKRAAPSRFDTSSSSAPSSWLANKKKRSAAAAGSSSTKLTVAGQPLLAAAPSANKFERRVHAAARRGDALKRRATALLGSMQQTTTRNVFIDETLRPSAAVARRDLFSLADDESVLHAGSLSIRAPGEAIASHEPLDDADDADKNALKARRAAAVDRKSKLSRAVERGRLLKSAKRELRSSADSQLASLNDRFDRLAPRLRPLEVRKPAAPADDYASALAALRDAPRARIDAPLPSTAADTRQKRSAPGGAAATDAPAPKQKAELFHYSFDEDGGERLHTTPGDDDNDDDGSFVDSADEGSDDADAAAAQLQAALKQRKALAVPQTVDDFDALVRDLTPQRVVDEIMRILRCTDGVQLAHFTAVLLEFYAAAAQRKPAPLALLNALVAPLNVLANAHAGVATRVCRQLVRDMTPGAALHALEAAKRKAAKAGDGGLSGERAEQLRAHALKQLVQRRARMPTLQQLLVMRVQLELWPVNDARHVILTPLALRLAQAMMLGRLSTPGDLYRAFFCIALFKPLVLGERRYAAEPVYLLTALLTTLLEYDDPNDADIARTGVQRGAAPVAPALLRIGDERARRTLAPRPLTLPALVHALDGTAGSEDDERATLTPQQQVDCIRHALVELAFFVELYADSVALPEVMARTARLLDELPEAPLLPEQCVPLAVALQTSLETATLRVLQTRAPLALQAHMATPRSAAIVSKDILVRDEHDPANAREKTRKLRLRVRREEKGAMRELRRDAFFMADERHKRWLAERAEIDKREREILGMLSRQQGEMNILEHIKKGKAPKAGVGKLFNAASK